MNNSITQTIEIKMKVFKYFLTIILFLCFSNPANAKSWKDDWIVNGIKVNEVTYSNIFGLCSGILVSSIMHLGGHIFYKEMNGIEWHQEGIFEKDDECLSDSDTAMSGRSGFLTQLAIGTILRYTPLYGTSFVLGYNVKTAFDITTYPILFNGTDYGDLKSIERDGNRDIEYFIYSGFSIWLLTDKE